MTIPSLPFFLSSAISEMQEGFPNLVSSCVSLLGGGFPFFCSSLSGKSFFSASLTVNSIGSTTAQAVANVIGGAPPYSYGWAVSTGFTIQSASANTCNIFSSGDSGNVSCTVSDSAGRQINIDAAITIVGGGGGTKPCVLLSSYLPYGMRAWQAVGGTRLRVLDAAFAEPEDAFADLGRTAWNWCVRITSESGIALGLSANTHITQPDGNWGPKARDALGAWVAVEDERGFRWERLVKVKRIGLRRVRKISVQNKTYAAGEMPGRYLYTHNAKE
ncbi:MAG: hypothetical protein WA840_19775 [Caulobacteraceae bacterium]